MMRDDSITNPTRHSFWSIVFVSELLIISQGVSGACFVGGSMQHLVQME
jgi:hypothetical protein